MCGTGGEIFPICPAATMWRTLALCHFIEKHISHREHRVAEIVIEPQDAKDSGTICWSCPGETTATIVSLGKQD